MGTLGQRASRAGAAFSQGVGQANSALLSSNNIINDNVAAHDRLEKKLIRVTAAEHEAGAAAAEAARKIKDAHMANVSGRIGDLQGKLGDANRMGNAVGAEKLRVEIDRLNAGYGRLNAIKSKYASTVDRVKSKVSALTASLRGQAAAQDNVGKSTVGANVAMGMQAKNMSTFSRNSFPMMGAMNAIMGMQGAAQGSFMSMAFSLLFVNKQTIIWTASLVTLGGVLFGVISAVKRFSMLENLRDKLEGVIRDSEKTARVWEYLESFRIQSPFDRADIIDAAITMKRANLELVKWSESAGNIAAANETTYSDVIERIARIARDTRRDSGRLALSDLIAIGLDRKLLQQYGVLIDEAGLIANDVATTLKAVHAIGLKEFAGEMQKDLEKIDVQWNKTKETIGDLLVPLGEKWLPVAKRGFGGLIFVASMAVNVLDAIADAIFYIGRVIKPALDWLGLLMQTIKQSEFFSSLVQAAKEFADSFGMTLSGLFGKIFNVRIEHLRFKLGQDENGENSYDLEGIDTITGNLESSIGNAVGAIGVIAIANSAGGLKGKILRAIGYALVSGTIIEKADDEHVEDVKNMIIKHVDFLIPLAIAGITAKSFGIKWKVLGAAVLSAAAIGITAEEVGFSTDEKTSIKDHIVDNIDDALLLLGAVSLSPPPFKKSVFAGVAAAIIASKLE